MSGWSPGRIGDHPVWTAFEPSNYRIVTAYSEVNLPIVPLGDSEPSRGRGHRDSVAPRPDEVMTRQAFHEPPPMLIRDVEAREAHGTGPSICIAEDDLDGAVGGRRHVVFDRLLTAGEHMRHAVVSGGANLKHGKKAAGAVGSY